MIFSLCLIAFAIGSVDLNEGFIPDRLNPMTEMTLPTVDLPNSFDWGDVNGVNYLTLI